MGKTSSIPISSKSYIYTKNLVHGTTLPYQIRYHSLCPEPEDLEEDTVDTVVDVKTLREIIPTLPFTIHSNRNLKPEDWKDMDQVLQLQQLLKDLFQWNMDNKSSNLASHQEELVASCQKIWLKELMVIAKGWNPTTQFRLLEERETGRRENQATSKL
ncbi:hypothetical protein O181_024144 [Austropuccinia psidii MF-1]|uniref:Uncharacterized protein n=1 Tax=Austropuccinia psidii MF-1 TaxID=1389203 RepID=A0A9Q3CI31_9BASI|nr:hypothetical protein [Austropuccinia psidii MF-1]